MTENINELSLRYLLQDQCYETFFHEVMVTKQICWWRQLNVEMLLFTFRMITNIAKKSLHGLSVGQRRVLGHEFEFRVGQQPEIKLKHS